jgi:hypothetical protein
VSEFASGFKDPEGQAGPTWQKWIRFLIYPWALALGSDGWGQACGSRGRTCGPSIMELGEFGGRTPEVFVGCCLLGGWWPQQVVVESWISIDFSSLWVWWGVTRDF